MEYSDFHLRTIIKVGARFGFSNFDVHPDEITNAIGVEPDGTSIRGETRLLPKGKTLVIPSSCWWVESKSDSKDINAHLRQLFNRLDGVESSLNPSYGEPWMTVKYKSNYLYMGSGPILEAEVLETMAKLRVELAFDIYQVDQELSEEELEDDIQRITKQEMMGGSSDSEFVKS